MFYDVHPQFGDTSDDMVTYILRILSCTFMAGNKFQKIYFFSGSGANGKSMLTDLMTNVFGDNSGAKGFVDTTKAQTLGGRRETGQHEQEFTELFAKTRLLFINVPDKQAALAASTVKSLTGGDKQKSRGAFAKASASGIMSWTPFVNCNHIPKFDEWEDEDRGNNDFALIRRVEIVYFPFSFGYQEDKAGMEKMGLKWKLRVDSLRPYVKSVEARNAMLYMLIHAFNDFRKGGACEFSIPVPACCKSSNLAYFEQSDPLSTLVEFLDGRRILEYTGKQDDWARVKLVTGELDLSTRNVISFKVRFLNPIKNAYFLPSFPATPSLSSFSPRLSPPRTRTAAR